MTAPHITAIVLTLNEEEHLPGCLASIDGLGARIIVLDSGSTDRTVQIAKEHAADVVHRPFSGYASQRNAGLSMAGDTRWILFLDADERLTEESRTEILARIDAVSDDVAAFWLPRKNVAFGRVLRGGGWWPDYQARLIRCGRGRYDETRQVHEVVLYDGRTERLREPFVHLNYATRREFMQKQCAYTLRHVHQNLVGTPRRRAYLGRPVREFWRRFVALKGYRDGVTGLFMAVVMAFEEIRCCMLLRRREAA
ncbi:MAG: glycosyltransferase family 2 protein [Chloroflexia bacterium]|nr:glycosyltransferase family 2 protein [Chloroflexia bacterium]